MTEEKSLFTILKKAYHRDSRLVPVLNFHSNLSKKKKLH